MNCFLCNKSAEYSCSCAVPIVFICHDHLKIHKADKTIKHPLKALEDERETILYKGIRDKLQKINDEIILNSLNQAKEIREKNKQSLCLINGIAQSLYKRYLENKLNEGFLEEMFTNCKNENDKQIFKSYTLIEDDSLIKNKNTTTKINKIYSNGNKYEGDWENGKKQGIGIYKYASGDIYEGEFMNDLKEGRGIYKYASGGIYEGEFMNNVKEGRGILSY